MNDKSHQLGRPSILLLLMATLAACSSPRAAVRDVALLAEIEQSDVDVFAVAEPSKSVTLPGTLPALTYSYRDSYNRVVRRGSVIDPRIVQSGGTIGTLGFGHSEFVVPSVPGTLSVYDASGELLGDTVVSRVALAATSAGTSKAAISLGGIFGGFFKGIIAIFRGGSSVPGIPGTGTGGTISPFPLANLTAYCPAAETFRVQRQALGDRSDQRRTLEVMNYCKAYRSASTPAATGAPKVLFVNEGFQFRGNSELVPADGPLVDSNGVVRFPADTYELGISWFIAGTYLYTASFDSGTQAINADSRMAALKMKTRRNGDIDSPFGIRESSNRFSIKDQRRFLETISALKREFGADVIAVMVEARLTGVQIPALVGSDYIVMSHDAEVESLERNRQQFAALLSRVKPSSTAAALTNLSTGSTSTGGIAGGVTSGRTDQGSIQTEGDETGDESSGEGDSATCLAEDCGFADTDDVNSSIDYSVDESSYYAGDEEGYDDFGEWTEEDNAEAYEDEADFGAADYDAGDEGNENYDLDNFSDE